MLDLEKTIQLTTLVVIVKGSIRGRQCCVSIQVANGNTFVNMVCSRAHLFDRYLIVTLLHMARRGIDTPIK